MVCYTESFEMSYLEAVWKRAGTFKKNTICLSGTNFNQSDQQTIWHRRARPKEINDELNSYQSQSGEEWNHLLHPSSFSAVLCSSFSEMLLFTSGISDDIAAMLLWCIRHLVLLLYLTLTCWLLHPTAFRSLLCQPLRAAKRATSHSSRWLLTTSWATTSTWANSTNIRCYWATSSSWVPWNLPMQTCTPQSLTQELSKLCKRSMASHAS